MTEKPFYAVWHKDTSYCDRGYESVEAARFASLAQAVVHLDKNINPDFKSMVAIDVPNAPVFLMSAEDDKWEATHRICVSKDWLQRMKSIGFSG